jgi:hypothetical protein
MFSRRLILVLLRGGLLTLLSVAALACASCGPFSGAGAPRRSTAPTAALPGLGPRVASVDWTLLWFVVDGTDYYATDGPPITLKMDPTGASASGASGCNHYSGTYTAEGSPSISRSPTSPLRHRRRAPPPSRRANTPTSRRSAGSRPMAPPL